MRFNVRADDDARIVTKNYARSRPVGMLGSSFSEAGFYRCFRRITLKNRLRVLQLLVQSSVWAEKLMGSPVETDFSGFTGSGGIGEL